MRRSGTGDGVPRRRSSGRSSSCSREIDWIADEHGGLQRPSKHFKAEDRKRTAEYPSYKTGNSIKRNTWSQEEDDILSQMVDLHCSKNWSKIASSIPGRSREQWRERWIFYLDPAVNHQPWSEHEDITLIRAHRILGNKWCKLAKHFPGRTRKAVKNHWHTLMKRMNSDLVRGLIIKNKGSGTIKSGQDLSINIQVAVDWPIRPKPEQGLSEDGRNASALKKKGSHYTQSERSVSVNVSEWQIARSSLPVVTKEKEVLPSTSAVQKVSCVAENLSTSLQNKELANCLEAPLKGVNPGFYPADYHISIHDHSHDICSSSANPDSPELHLGNIAELLDMSYCESLMIVPPDSPNDGNSMEGMGALV